MNRMPKDRFSYSLPFGAELAGDGQVRFRLWAPDQREVAVVFEKTGKVILMEREDDGWFGLTAAAAPGQSYSYRIANELSIPDPASRAQADDVHGPSLIVDPRSYRWTNHGWTGRPWEETVLLELHVGTATPEGTFEGLRRRLDHFARIGITAIELMPVADFPGKRGWGYDGVLPFAPDRSYGSPDDLKRLVDEAHGRGLMVFLDVVYNHFGPEGNYLHELASSFFDEGQKTPWGAAIDFTRREVRDFFIHNALYWLDEYRFDGLRLDAVHAIKDPSSEHFLEELAKRVRAGITDRQVHLVLENDDNTAAFLRRGNARRPLFYDAQWNDDFHHVAHVLLTGETDGYYGDYADDPANKLARALASGFIYQGEPSAFRDGSPRGEPSGDLPSTAFVNFIQNHDQVGNRALGERLTTLAQPNAVEALLALLLLAPQVPLLFMGEEWGETRPFLYFCHFHEELARAVREGRRGEFARFERFRSEEAMATIPDPNGVPTFEASKIDWAKLDVSAHAGRLSLVRRLLELRGREIVPRLPALSGEADAAGSLIAARWMLADGARLGVVANLGPSPRERAGPLPASSLWSQPENAHDEPLMPAWSVAWTLEAAPR